MQILQLGLLVLAAGGWGDGRDTVLAGAEAELARGRPWQASRLIAPVLADSGTRTPGAVYLAATAASRWGGWREVRRLLDGQPWLDSLDGGRPRALLARAALEEFDDTAALAHGLAALHAADTAAAGETLVLLGRALERLNARDSAARVYAAAARRLPTLADWLLIRAAALTDDAQARERLYARVFDELPRGRIAWAEAAAREHVGDLGDAAERYALLGDPVRAVRLGLATSPDSAARAALRRRLLSLIADRGPADAREAIALLDEAFGDLSPSEALTVARAAGRSGLAGRAAAGYEAGFAAGLGGPQDRFDYAVALGRLGRVAEAAAAFDKVRLPVAPRTLAASAAYQRARILVRDGQLAEGRSALEALARRFPRDTAAAAALNLLADLATDAGRDVEARTLFRRIAARFPASRLTPAARFRAAIIALVGGAPADAARELDVLAQRFPSSDEAPAARYWAGRAWAAAGDSAAAQARWQLAAAGEPVSYYADLARRRLGLGPWVPPAAADSFPVVPVVDSAVARAARLARLGLVPESRWEYERLARQADASVERLLATAAAFRDQGLASQAVRLARRAQAAGAPADARLYRLLYPVIHEDALLAEAAGRGLDPSFVAALVRQESLFNPDAVSRVGARGLMQLMPRVGERLAQALGYPVWDPVLLYQPDVSLQLGTAHLRELTAVYDQPVRILAAYNAGASRVERWLRKVGAQDPEVFAERIPFTETRDYVRIIQRNQQIYRALYAWPTGA